MITSLTAIITYILISIYHLRSGFLLNFSLLKDNMGLLLYKESINVIFNIPTRKDYIELTLLILLLLFLEYKKKKLSSIPKLKIPLLQLSIAISGLTIIIIKTPYIYDEFTCFSKSVYSYYYPSTNVITFKNPSQQYPFIKDRIKQLQNRQIANPITNDTPNIFIIFFESFNANFVRTKNISGSEYTPFFNSLIQKGVYFENFYGPSIQTSKGQFASLCSLLPLIHKKAFLSSDKLNLNCLPSILQNNGYHTIFTKAYHDMNFDNTYNFVAKNGFNHIWSMDHQFITREERAKHTWGWGIQDNIYYKKVFNKLDQIKLEKQSEKLFVTFTTVSNHMKFKKVPKNQRALYPNQKNGKEYYANSINVADGYLKTFFEELNKRDYLKNSLIIILGDHSFPVGEHGSYHNESGYYNEYFKTPLLMIWNKKLNPQVISKNRSQIDIAPTILKLLKINTKNHFTGANLFSPTTSNIFLIQPYAGTFTGLITPNKFKYIYHEKTSKEFLFNLNSDPNENHNIIDQISQKQLKIFRHKLSFVYVNDFLIRKNRIWKTDQ